MGLTLAVAHKLVCFKRASSLLTIIELGWKGLPRTNPLAYFKHLLFKAMNSFIAFPAG